MNFRLTQLRENTIMYNRDIENQRRCKCTLCLQKDHLIRNKHMIPKTKGLGSDPLIDSVMRYKEIHIKYQRILIFYS